MPERLIPGGPFVVETSANARQIPGGPFVNETVSLYPVLTSPELINLTQTQATPRVTITVP